jgi:hypothetical protein
LGQLLVTEGEVEIPATSRQGRLKMMLDLWLLSQSDAMVLGKTRWILLINQVYEEYMDYPWSLLQVASRRACTGGCPPSAPLSLPEVSRSQLSKLWSYKVYIYKVYIFIYIYIYEVVYYMYL